MKNLKENALSKTNIAKMFTNGELSRTFTDNESALSHIKNICFKTNGVYEQAGKSITVTTPKNTHKLELI